MSEETSTTTGPRAGAKSAGGLWTAKDVAAFLSVSRTWVYQQAEAGLMPVRRLPGSPLLRFDEAEIRAYAKGEWKPPTVVPIKRAG